MNPDELRNMLGLRPHADFEFDQLLKLPEKLRRLGRDRAVAERFRGTGRTTETLFAAFYSALKGQQVVHVSHTSRLAETLRRRVLEWVMLAGIAEITTAAAHVVYFHGAGRIRFESRVPGAAGCAGEVLYEDHYCGGE